MYNGKNLGANPPDGRSDGGKEGHSMTRPLIPLGYCLIRRTGSGHLPPCCPPEYPAVAGCPCKAVIPDVDNIPIAPPQFAPMDLGQKWDIPPESAEKLFQLNDEINRSGRINYTLLNYMSFEDAAQVRDSFFHGREDVLLLGLGGLDPALLSRTELQQVSPFPANGALLGFDLYGIGDSTPEDAPREKPDYARISIMGFGCPICCCDADGSIPKTLGVSLNRFGLYENPADAVRAADLVNQHHLGEPVWYLPLALIRC